MGTISLKDKEIERARAKPDGYHGYHERSRDEFGLQMDSIEAVSHSVAFHTSVRNCLKHGRLEVVARDGIEPPTPAFSGLRSTN